MTPEAPLLVIAMKEEAWAFPRPQREGGRGYLRVGGLRHESIFSGPGQASVAGALIGRRPAALLHVGFAGALRPDFQAGQVFRIASIRQGSEVVAVDLEAARLALGEFPLASIVTLPAPATAATKILMHRHGAADLVDMESFHVHAFCQDLGIPYIGLRVVSDSLEDEIPGVLQESFDGRRFRLGPIVRAFITDARARRELLHLRSRARLAARNLASALFGAP